MFEQKKLLIFHNVFQSNVFEESFGARKEQLLQSERHIIVLVETGEVKRKESNVLYRWLKKNAKQQEFLLLSPVRLKEWVEGEFLRYGLQATPRAQEELARAVGNNLWQMSQEVRKIAAWKGTSTTKQVKESDVALFVSLKTETDIFATIDSIAQKNRKESLALLYRHLQKGESPYYLFTMLVYQFRTILQISDMLERKFTYGAMLKKTKLHPYVLKKGLRISQNFLPQQLLATYEKLFTLDLGLKTGRIEAEGAFDLLVATL